MGDALSGLWQAALPVALALAAAALVFGLAAVAWRRMRPRPPARLVEVLAPPEVDPAGAAAFWRHLHSALSPRGLRSMWGRPHVAFQLAWAAGRLRVGVLVPAGAPAAAVARAVEGAWPGARAGVAETEPVLRPGMRVRGGSARLAAPEWFPLAVDGRGPDPYRMLLASVADLSSGEAAVVQVLARPARAGRLRRARRAVDALRRGAPSGLAAWLDVLRSPAPGGRARTGPADPGTLADVRAAQGKLAAPPAFVAAVRWAVTGPAGDRRRLRARGRDLAAAFGAWHGRNSLRVRRVRGAARLLGGLRMGRGDLLSLEELCSLAHLPHDGAVGGWGRAGGRTLAPVPELLLAEDGEAWR